MPVSAMLKLGCCKNLETLVVVDPITGTIHNPDGPAGVVAEPVKIIGLVIDDQVAGEIDSTEGPAGALPGGGLDGELEC